MTRLITFLLWRRVIGPACHRAFEAGFEAGFKLGVTHGEWHEALHYERLLAPSMN